MKSLPLEVDMKLDIISNPLYELIRNATSKLIALPLRQCSKS